jgi:DNA repair exonuclease SbcCD ATPase subunit
MKIVDEQACRYQTEYDKVARQLDTAIRTNDDCRTQLEDSLKQLHTAKEDLEVTRNNYETQLRLLTEHFVKLNEQVSKQEEQLSRLKSHKVCHDRGACGASCPIQWIAANPSHHRSIDRRLGEQVNCGKCGSWNTVQWLITEGGGGKRCCRGNHPSSYNFA